MFIEFYLASVSQNFFTVNCLEIQKQTDVPIPQVPDFFYSPFLFLLSN